MVLLQEYIPRSSEVLDHGNFSNPPKSGLRYQKTAQAHRFPEGQNTPDRYIVGAGYALLEVRVTCMLFRLDRRLGSQESRERDTRETDTTNHMLYLLDLYPLRLKSRDVDRPLVWKSGWVDRFVAFKNSNPEDPG